MILSSLNLCIVTTYLFVGGKLLHQFLATIFR